MSSELGLHHVVQRKKGIIQRMMCWVKKEHNFDDIMIFMAVIYPLTILPQIIKIMHIQDASAISLLSFSLKAIFAIPWIYYGIKHKSNPIIISNVLWFFGYSVIIIETFYF